MDIYMHMCVHTRTHTAHWHRWPILFHLKLCLFMTVIVIVWQWLSRHFSRLSSAMALRTRHWKDSQPQIMMDSFTCHGKEERRLLLSISFMNLTILFLSYEDLSASELSYVFKKDGGVNSSGGTLYICRCFHISRDLLLFFFPGNRVDIRDYLLVGEVRRQTQETLYAFLQQKRKITAGGWNEHFSFEVVIPYWTSEWLSSNEWMNGVLVIAETTEADKASPGLKWWFSFPVGNSAPAPSCLNLISGPAVPGVFH